MKKGFLIFITSVLGLLFFFIFKNKIEIMNYFSIIGFLIILLGFYFSDKLFNFNFKLIHYIFTIYIAVFGFLLVFLMYYIFFIDKILHFTGGLMLALIIYHILKKFKIKKIFLCSFLICLSIILLFELMEYSLGNILGVSMQGVFSYSDGEYKMILNPVYDTLADIFLGTIGALISLRYKFKNH